MRRRVIAGAGREGWALSSFQKFKAVVVGSGEICEVPGITATYSCAMTATVQLHDDEIEAPAYTQSIRVSDTCIGITADQMTRLFKR